MSKKSTSKWFSTLFTEQLQLEPVLLLKWSSSVEEMQAFCGQSDNKWKVTSSVATRVTQPQAVVQEQKHDFSFLDELCDPLWVMPVMSNFNLNS